ncbi:heterokaryon incompatibility protein-domain-containing protein [Astrocystis sublimbata]|nr:heterokaryon incompatibility protein-domain-containing protein [Astrocystis sublimbata]
MRFVNTTTFKFVSISDSEIDTIEGGYCILSHRWSDNEISYSDLLSMGLDYQAKEGYEKFSGSCLMARELGFDLLWMDSCCINKTDHVELSEAINLMYRWYSKSTKCIAYLQDVTLPDQLKESEWFSRGWTLQELIAPKVVQFYGRNWISLGTKEALASHISSTTGIPVDVLRNKTNPTAYSVAQRMSWASKRTTTRLEDRAYSLLGLFDVNMPMIYGERDRAFLRLQELIISRSSDESIFIWDLDLLEGSIRDAKQVFCGLLAPSPACFARSRDVVLVGHSRGFHINQFGLSISLQARRQSMETIQAMLNVGRVGKLGQCTIFLAKLPNGELYTRRSTSLGESSVLTRKTRWIQMDFTVSQVSAEPPPELYPGYWLRKMDFHDSRIQSVDTLQRIDAKVNDRLRLPFHQYFGTAGIIRLCLWNGRSPVGAGWIKLGFNSESQPICLMTFSPERSQS